MAKVRKTDVGKALADSKGNIAPIYDTCTYCGGPLPCIECARRLQKTRGFTPEPTEEPSLAPEIAEAARKIREDGFIRAKQVSKIPYFQEPWDEYEYKVRAGVSVEPYEFRMVIDPR